MFRMVILSDSTLEDTFWHWQAAICVIVVVLLTVGVSIRKPLKDVYKRQSLADSSCKVASSHFVLLRPARDPGT